MKISTIFVTLCLVLSLSLSTVYGQAVAATGEVDCTSDTGCRWTFEYTVSGGDYTVGPAFDNFLDIAPEVGADNYVNVTEEVAVLSFLDGTTATFSYSGLCSSSVAWIINSNSVAVDGSSIVNKCGVCVPVSTPPADFEKCSDGNLCFAGGVCQDNGSCLADPLPCEPANACIASAQCTPAAGCVQIPVDCDDNNPCTIDTCSGGVCSNTLDLFAAGCTESSISSALTTSPNSPGTVPSTTTTTTTSDDDDDDDSSSSWSHVTPWSDHETSASSDGGHGLSTILVSYLAGPAIFLVFVVIIFGLVWLNPIAQSSSLRF